MIPSEQSRLVLRKAAQDQAVFVEVPYAYAIGLIRQSLARRLDDNPLPS